MIVVSSALPPAPRGSGIRSVPAVTGPARQTPGSRQPKSATSAPGPEQSARGEPVRLDGEGYIDAEFVEVLREAASAAVIIDPADGTLRQALDAYRTAGQSRIIPGSIIDLAA